MSLQYYIAQLQECKQELNELNDILKTSSIPELIDVRTTLYQLLVKYRTKVEEYIQCDPQTACSTMAQRLLMKEREISQSNLKRMKIEKHPDHGDMWNAAFSRKEELSEQIVEMIIKGIPCMIVSRSD